MSMALDVNLPLHPLRSPSNPYLISAKLLMKINYHTSWGHEIRVHMGNAGYISWPQGMGHVRDTLERVAFNGPHILLL